MVSRASTTSKVKLPNSPARTACKLPKMASSILQIHYIYIYIYTYIYIYIERERENADYIIVYYYLTNFLPIPNRCCERANLPPPESFTGLVELFRSLVGNFCHPPVCRSEIWRSIESLAEVRCPVLHVDQRSAERSEDDSTMP